MSTLDLIVHRSTQEIGGNCIELTAGDGHRIFLDVGRPLAAPREAINLLPATVDRSKPALGVLISHPHQDHYGLLNELPPSWPIHCGRATEKLIHLTTGITGQRLGNTFHTWQSGQTFELGPFKITPYLTDHSAFDAHMLLIDACGQRILYTGDFRTHGRKAWLVRQFMKAPPPNIDILLMEGTNLGSDKPCMSESDLEDDFINLFQRTTGRVFVAWSAQNIDRTVTIYRACLKTGRTLLIDLYTAEVLEVLAAHGKLPQPDWSAVKVMVTGALARMYKRTGRSEFVERMARHGVSARALNQTPGKWVSMIRPSMLRDLERASVTPDYDDAWCWSMWSGYLKNDDGQRLADWFGAGQSKACPIHSSGHASASELRAFGAAMKPKRLVPIHGVAWDREDDGFPVMQRLVDGEKLEMQLQKTA